MNGSSPTQSLRARLRRGGIVTAPGAYDALSALLIEQAGFEEILGFSEYAAYEAGLAGGGHA